MNFDDYSTLRFDLDRHVLTLRLSRPEAMNAVSAVMHEELSRVFAQIAACTEVHAVVLTGEGRAFCAGGDLEWFSRITPTQLDALFREARRIVIDLLELPQPIIAAVNGHAAGLGCTLALLCDWVLLAEGARLSDPHVRIGVAAGDGGAAIWPLLVGPARAKQYLMTGDALDSAEAERIGLVNQALPAEQLLPAALAIARRLADGPRQAIEATKASINQLVRGAMSQVLDVSLAREKENFASADHREAVSAFIARREPKFVGR